MTKTTIKRGAFVALLLIIVTLFTPVSALVEAKTKTPPAPAMTTLTAPKMLTTSPLTIFPTYYLKEIPYSWDGADNYWGSNNGDDNYMGINIPWDFPFYGSNYTGLDMSSNGYLSMHNGSNFNASSYSDEYWSIDLINGIDNDGTGSGALIAAWNKDLSSYYNGQYRYAFKGPSAMTLKTDVTTTDSNMNTDEDRAVFEWITDTYTDSENGMGFAPTVSINSNVNGPTDTLNNFETVLYPDGRIKVDYNYFHCNVNGGCRNDYVAPTNDNTNAPTLETVTNGNGNYVENYKEGISNGDGTHYVVFGGYNNNWTTFPDVYNGSLAQRSFLYTTDIVPPVVTIESPVSGSTLRTATPLIVHTNENANCSYQVDSGKSLPMSYTGQLLHTQYISGISVGAHMVTVQCTDPSYNTGSAFVRWTKGDTQGQILYGTDGAGRNEALTKLYTLNPETGEIASTVGTIGDFKVTGLAFDPTTQILYGSTGAKGNNYDSLLTINRITGSGTLIGPVYERLDEVPAFASTVITDSNTNSSSSICDTVGYLCHNLADIAFDHTGQLYGWSEENDMLYKVDKLTGLATRIGNPDELSTWGSGLEFDGLGKLYFTGEGDTYSANSNPDFIARTEFSIAPGTGRLITLTPSTAGINTAIPLLGGSEESYAIGALTIDQGGLLFGTRTPYGRNPPSGIIVIKKDTGTIVPLSQTSCMEPTLKQACSSDPRDMMDAIAFYNPPVQPSSGGGGGGSLAPRLPDSQGILPPETNSNINNNGQNENTNASTGGNENVNGTDYFNQMGSLCQVADYRDLFGIGTGVFQPDEPISRAELIKLLIKCRFGDLSTPTRNPFPDVSKSMWYAPYIAKAKELGWIKGYKDGLFKPNQNVARVEALKVLLLSHFTSDQITGGEMNFLDTVPGSWYEPYVAFSVLMHFIEGYRDAEGYPTGYFGPANPITRWEATKIFVLILKS